MKLIDKVIFITGATKGIGLELAKQLKKYNTVVIGGRNKKELNDLSQEFNTMLFDVLDNESISTVGIEIQRRFGKLDVLINNAAILNSGNFYQTEFGFEKIEKEILTNVASPIKLTELLLPLLAEQKESAVVNITSAVAYLPMPNLPVYSATKAALQSFTYSLRASLLQTNIKVFEALPPFVSTRMTENLPGKAKNMKKISAEKCARQIVKGIENNNLTIHIGSSKLLYWSRRLFPKLVQKKLNKM